MSNDPTTPVSGIAWLERGIGVVRIPVPLPVKATNVYLLGDPPEAIVDCGPLHPVSLDALRGAFDGIGRPRVILATHLHVDHYGASGAIQREWGCEVWMGEADAEEGWRFFAGPRDDHLYWEAFVRYGVPREGAEATYEAVRYVRDLMDYPVINRRLLDGEELALGGRSWRVLVTPGHTTGHICLFDERQGILLAGDHVLPRITPNIGLSTRDGFNAIQEYVKSLDRTASLGGRVAYPGHGPAIDNPAERARQIIHHHVLRARRVLEILGSGARNGYEVALGLWGNALDAFQMRFAVAEAVAHLDWLAAEGWVEKQVRDGVYVYRAVRPGETFEVVSWAKAGWKGADAK